MNKSKYAIYNSSGFGKNQGGPKGYLYNLFNGLNELNYQMKIFSLDDIDSIQSKKNNSYTKKKSIKDFIPLGFRSILYFYKYGIKIKNKINREVNSYDILHVHSSEDVYYLRKFLKYKGRIVLTVHRPESLAEEKIGALNINSEIPRKYRIMKVFMNRVEAFSYKTSDAFIFPSEHAMRIYNEFPGFKKYSKGKKIHYLFTGALLNKPTLGILEYRNKHNIPFDAKMVSYVGRHNYIKGYDLLVELEEKLRLKQIYTICAGAKSNITPENSQYWRELGYINDANNLINASDIVVIPNRNTYFDLVIIEILSHGKIVITSNTGGNIDIAKYTKGMVLFESGNLDSLYNAIINTTGLDENEKVKFQNQNLDFYNSYCSVVKFAQNYIDTVKNIEDNFISR